MRKDGPPHVVAVGFHVGPGTTGSPESSRNDTSQKARNADRGGYAAVSQVDGGRWLTLEGPARVLSDAASVTEGVERLCGAVPDAPGKPGHASSSRSRCKRVMGSAILVDR